MNVADALAERKSVRAFTDQAVSEEKIRKILKAASYAPSGVNTQPWHVAVVSGTKKKELEALIEAEFRAGEKSRIEYKYYPGEWTEPYSSRRKACGLQMYATLDIKREDVEKRTEQWAANYRAFDAPVVLYFFIDAILDKGSFMDYGMFLQSVMLSAVEEGLGTCPQAALAEYPDVVKKYLGYDDSKIVLCGMALGYEDTSALVNSYRTPREDIDTFTQFFS